jgi:hypothetical protein
MHLRLTAACCAILSTAAANAADRECVVERKFDVNGEVSESELAHWQPSVRIIEVDETVLLQRCSYSTAAAAVTCDSYAVDHVEVSPGFGVTKYYSFFHQFDVQVWPDGQFIENNGRRNIAFGHCS